MTPTWGTHGGEQMGTSQDAQDPTSQGRPLDRPEASPNPRAHNYSICLSTRPTYVVKNL